MILLELFNEPKSELVVGRGILSEAGQLIGTRLGSSKACVITDDNTRARFADLLLDSLARQGMKTSVFSFLAGEQQKCMQTAVDIYTHLAKINFTRSDVVVALGGGVVGDIAGFVASTYLRGVPCVQIPTTLLAQIDSAVGGKTGLNLPAGKNFVGTLVQPRMIISDPNLLDSLPQREVQSGISEAIKYGCIADAKLFERLGKERPFDFIEDLITGCVKIKCELTKGDPQERGKRLLLNFGHTFGHAIETLAGYNIISHGQAVAIGMVMITKASEKQGLTKTGTAELISKLLCKQGLDLTTDIPISELILKAKKDKKQLDGKLNLVLIKEIGLPFLHPIEPSLLGEFMVCEAS